MAAPKGKHMSLATEFKKGHVMNIGANNVNWKGGVSKDKKYIRKRCREWWRKKVESKASRPRPKQCEVCGIPSSDLKHELHFDHNHITGKFRGWLCGRCNVVLGLVKDNTELLEMLINYLKK